MKTKRLFVRTLVAAAFGTAAALNLAPVHSGTVRRGVDIRDDAMPTFLKRYAEGKVVTEPQFISATRRPRVQDRYRSNVQFVIQSRRGRAVERWAKDLDEREVLFSPGTRFRVDDVRDEGGKTIIKMTEVRGGEAR